MAIKKGKKEEIVKELTDELSKAKGIVFTNYKKVSANDVNALRSECYKENVKFRIAKKTLINIALKGAKIELDAKALKGQIGVAYSLEDEVAPAKVAATFKKGNESFELLNGILDGNALDEKEVAALAKLPSKEELLGKLVGTLNAPISGFVNVLAGNIRGLSTCLKAIADQKDNK